LQEKNGTHILVEAMRILCQKRDDVSLVIIGDGVERNRIEQMVEEYKLQERIKLIGHVLHEEVGGYLAATDIFCRPSLAEGFGIVYLEAMACDIPVVATPVGGIVDFLKHEETGLMAEVNNPEDLAYQLNRLLSDRALSEQIVTEARHMIARTYAWDAIASEMYSLYTRI
jgi:glycosyltransferase involved in cell wall biosynthesis